MYINNVNKNLQIDLEPQGKLRVKIDLQWNDQGKKKYLAILDKCT